MAAEHIRSQFVAPGFRSRAAIAAALVLMAAVGAQAAGYANDGPGGGPHRRINALALSRFIRSAAADPILKFYDFRPTIEKYGLPPAAGFFQVRSRTVTKSGSWHKSEPIWPGVTATFIEEGDVRSPFAWWVEEGGYTADEPESFMALRHFFDPLGLGVDSESGAKAAYLTDALDPWISPLLMGHNPRMDAVSWALRESPCAYFKGQTSLAYLAGLAADDKDREKEYGAAWRCLGEALHLLADMTVPAHVRNDAHPGSWIRKTLNGDPYEDYVEAETVTRCAAGPAPDAVRAEIAAAADPVALFRAVAAFTNRNFFSKDTISGTDGRTGAAVHSANGQPDYPSPKLDDYAFDRSPGEAGYYETPNRGFAAASRLNDGTHTVGAPTVTGQALALLPTAVEAGVRLIDMFMPRLKVTAESYDPATGLLSFRAVRQERDEAGRPIAAEAPVNPSSNASALVFLEAGGFRRTAVAAIIGDPAAGLRLDIGSVLAALAKDAAAGPAAELRLAIGIDMGGILVRSEPLALGPASPPATGTREPAPPKAPPLLDALRECRGVTIEISGEFPQQGARYPSSINQINGGNFNFFGRARESAEHPLKWNGTAFSASYSTVRRNESPSPLNPAPTITDTVSISGEISGDGRTIVGLTSVLASSNPYFNRTETIRVTGLPLQGDPLRGGDFAPAYFSESAGVVAASYAYSESPDPRLGAGQSTIASTDQGRFKSVRVSFHR
jgi:hypothetical protein